MHNWREVVCSRLAEAGVDPVADGNLVEELAQHLESRFIELQTRGATDEEAFAAALRELDGHERLIPELAANRPSPSPPPPVGGPPLSSRLAALWLDIRYAFRTLGRSPTFTITAILTVALSTGPTIAALSVGNWLFLRPAPGISQPERLASIDFGSPRQRGGYSVSFVSYDYVANLAASVPSIEAMAGFGQNEVSVAAGNEEAELTRAEFVSWNYFDVLGARLIAGRTFTANEDRRPGGTLSAVLSYRLAGKLFPEGSAVGRDIRVNGIRLTVIGVALREFSGSNTFERSDVWLTGLTKRQLEHATPENWAYSPDRGPFYRYVARLKPGSSFEQVGSDLQSAAATLSKMPGAAQPMLRSGFAAVPQDFGTVLGLLLGVGALLVIVGAANLANMFGFRGIRRSHETAVRRALGASGYRLMQLHAAESIIVAAAGSLIGLVLVAVVQAIVGGVVVANFELPSVSLDWRLVLMTMGLAAGVAVFMAVAPVRLARRDLTSTIRDPRHSSARTVARFRISLAILQLALSLTLMVGALLFVGTLRNLQAMDPGFNSRGVISYQLAFRTQGYSPERSRVFYRDLLPRLAKLPAVTAAAVSDGGPMLGGGVGWRVFVPGDASNEAHPVTTQEVTTDYFKALGISIVVGRVFDAEEVLRGSRETSVVISESLARRLFGGVPAVGRRLTVPKVVDQPSYEVQVVGVAEDVRFDNLTSPPPGIVYRPMSGSFGTYDSFLVRSTSLADRVIPLVREQVRALDPELPIQAVVMDEVVSLRLGQQRIFAWVLGILATIGFLLAAIGIHGLISQAVVERTREFGIRLAVGASRKQIVQLVLRSAFVVVAIGAPLGIALAAALARIVRSRLFGISAGDPIVYTVAIAALLAVVVGASFTPAWIASRSNPTDILRAE
jgi:predicted permease